MTTLQPVFQALGYRSEAQQRDLVKLLEAAGVFGDLPGVEDTLTDKQAQAVLNAVTFDTPERAADWLHDQTQEYMLHRQAGIERHECYEPEHFKRNRGELLNALHHLGILSEVKPKAKHYDHVLVLGAVEGATSTRLDMLRELWNDGVRFDNIHLLGSERPLDPEHEPIAKVATDVGSVMTEMQMMMARAYEKNETWPEALQNVRMFNVETFNQAHGRANTRDTIVSWLKEQKKNNMPLKGNVLVISSQPSVAYQDAAVKSVLGPEFIVETVGPRIGEDGLKISVAMDSIARQIDVGFPQLLGALKTQAAAPQRLVMLDPAEIEVDAATYQFRSGGDKNGVTEKRRYGAGAWDPLLDGGRTMLVHQHNGKYKLVDGHHLREKAVALNARGNGPGKIAAIVLGPEYSQQEAKIAGAYRNMAQDLTRGQADAADVVDGARALKEAQSPEVNQARLPKLDTGHGAIALANTLRDLSDEGLTMVAAGKVPPEAAAEVARRLKNDPERQNIAMNIISTQLGAMGRLPRVPEMQIPPASHAARFTPIPTATTTAGIISM